MIEVILCDNCGHNKVCALKQIKDEIAAAVKNSSQMIDNQDIVVDISCNHFISSNNVPWTFTPKGGLK